MISIDWVLSTAVSAIKSQFPEALSNGFIINEQGEFDPSTNRVVKDIVKSTVEIIPEKLTIEEIQASGLLQSDLKMYVIADKSYDISFNKLIECNSKIYRVKQIVESIVGSKVALWTIICSIK
ncbi:hypothetical protein SEA_EFFIE_170 [Acinetobacter phage Effie]|nr:hypothetical protein SEA_EFFIE_170 [Acinetobacter phage Effie]